MCSRADHSGLMLAARITFAHVSVYSATKLPNSADELANGSVDRYYRMRFCCKAHMSAYKERLTMETRAKIWQLELLEST